MIDYFADHAPSLESPASRIANVQGSDVDGDVLPFASRGIVVAASGDVRLTTVDGNTGTVPIVAGYVFPIRARKIWATGTTATGIVALA